MATELKLRRGTTSQHSTFTGAEAEVTVDTDKETVVVHDGTTAGGYALAREDMSNVPNDAISGDQIAGGDATFDSINVDSGTLFVDSVNNRVGIGTSSPTEALEVNGAVTADGLSVYGGIPRFTAGQTLIANGDIFSGIEFYSNDSSTNSSGTSFDIVDISTEETWNGSGNKHKIEFRTYGTASSPVGTASPATRMSINANGGDISFYEDTGTTPKFYWDASAESLGIGTMSPVSSLHISQGFPVITLTDSDAAGINSEISGASGRLTFNADKDDYGTGEIFFQQAGSEAMRIDSSGNVGIGTSSPDAQLHVDGTNNLRVGGSDSQGRLEIQAFGGGAGAGRVYFDAVDGTSVGIPRHEFLINGSEAARIDSSGNLLVGTTNVFGHVFSASGEGVSVSGEYNAIFASRSGGELMELNRQTSDGDIIKFRKDGSTVGSLTTFNGNILIGSENTNLRFTTNAFRPADAGGSNRDNIIDLGSSSARFDDIFATNGTIQTSDVNEKQNVEELSDAEARVAAKAKTLLRKFRWKSAVEEKGAEARIHFGIIAQDLEQAFIDEGLDAGRYGMFIRGEWYEAEVEKTRTVENDDGTETTETYMATETYDTAEEAPEGAVKKERLGVRYHELLAFIIAAI